MVNAQAPPPKSQETPRGRACLVGSWLLVVGTLAGGGAACAKADAADLVPDGPPLAMPAPPPRVITPVEEIAATPPAIPDPAPRTPPRQPPRPEPRTETPPPPVAAQPPAPPAAAPATTPVVTPEPVEVRAVPAAAAAAEERKVRDVMARASRDLNRVDYRRLSAEGRSQYDQSKRFSEQADQALKERNFVYAMTLADKAATLAAELAGRR